MARRGGQQVAERARLAGEQAGQRAELAGRQADQRAATRRRGTAQLANRLSARIDQRSARVRGRGNAPVNSFPLTRGR